MEYSGVERRRTKKDLKRKRLFRKYKRGGQFRSSEIPLDSNKEPEQKMRNKK